MSESNTYHIADFVADLTRVSFTDILVHVSLENKTIFMLEDQIEDQFQIPFNTRLNQLYKIAVQHKKTSDIQSLCLAETVFSWTYKDKFIQTPLFLTPLQINFNKIKQEFRVSVNQDGRFINPFLINTLAHDFDLNCVFSEQLSAIDQWSELKTLLVENEFSFETHPFRALGNFHHHRYEIIRDLEELDSLEEPNYLVKLLLGLAPDYEKFHLALSENNCFSSDTDQELIFEHIQEKNIVIQGPPGTGKSQVLSNLLVKLLARGNKHLLVSEKKTALEVLEKKLKSVGLNHFAFVLHSQLKNNDFIGKLRQTWKLLEEEKFQQKPQLNLSKLQLSRLQLLLDKMNQSSLISVHSIQFFQDFQSNKHYDKIPFVSNLPELPIWEKLYPEIVFVLDQIKYPSILGLIKQSVLQHYPNLDEHFQELSRLYESIPKLLEINNLDDIDQILKLAARIQLLNNEAGKSYSAIISSPNQLKKLEKLKKKYFLLEQRLELLVPESKLWKNLPSKSEIDTWKINLIQGNWFKKRKTQITLKKLLHLDELNLVLALENLELYYAAKNEFIELKYELQKLGIDDPKHELDLVSYYIKQFQSLQENEINQIANLEPSYRQIIIDQAPALKRLERKLNDFLDLEPSHVIREKLEDLKKGLAWLLPIKKTLCELPPNVYKLFKFSQNATEINEIALKSTWVNFSSHFPELAQIDGGQLFSKLNQIIDSEKAEHLDFAQNLLFQRQEKFKYYHQLLSTPTLKLKAEEKALKNQLKIGKAILIKEFSKSKQHKSLRELMMLESSVWIDLLCPLFLCTPGMVSKNFPLQNSPFECLIFDEASQLILPKALACLQRAKRVIIAGDEQQMSPSSFFSGSLNSVDLLHQASFYLPNSHLHHHYRSKHDQLIAFSNEHFYHNELIAYPEPKPTEEPIQFYHVSTGVYDNRQNLDEAKAVATHIEKFISSSQNIGIVAFSEHQLSCIWKQINPAFYPKIDERIKNGSLFMKPLEQVQGEECDRLIISLGYAKNPIGEFHLRFGPLNQKSGVKRLNVLFTRAIENIDFFSSIKSIDFPYTANEAINLLRLYLAQIETKNKDSLLRFPFALKPKTNGTEMILDNVHLNFIKIQELKTFHQVMSDRSWKISYDI